MTQYLLPSGEDEKKSGIGNILRTINNSPSSAQRTGEENENKHKIVILQHLKESRNITQAFERVELICREAEIIRHGKKHAEFIAKTSGEILKRLGFSAKDVNLAEIAGYLHDLGYRLEIEGHSLVSAGMAYERLKDLGMVQEEIDKVCLAIGYHNQSIINNIGAALIIAEATDFSKSRVREGSQIDTLAQMMRQTISNKVIIDEVGKLITLDFQIEFYNSTGKKEFLLCQRRKLEVCRDAVKYLGCTLKVIVNGEEI